LCGFAKVQNNISVGWQRRRSYQQQRLQKIRPD